MAAARESVEAASVEADPGLEQFLVGRGEATRPVGRSALRVHT